MPEDREIASPVISNVKNPPWGTEPDTPATGLLTNVDRLAAHRCRYRQMQIVALYSVDASV